MCNHYTGKMTEAGAGQCYGMRQPIEKACRDITIQFIKFIIFNSGMTKNNCMIKAFSHIFMNNTWLSIPNYEGPLLPEACSMKFGKLHSETC